MPFEMILSESTKEGVLVLTLNDPATLNSVRGSMIDDGSWGKFLQRNSFYAARDHLETHACLCIGHNAFLYCSFVCINY